MPATAWPPNRVETAWGVLAVICLATMIVWPAWETIPFHIIWITLTLLYGFRVWSPAVTAAVLGTVIIGTGASILADAFEGLQLWGELFEVPLMSAMFLAMVWHARRRVLMHQTVELLAGERAALLEQQERLVQNVSHELRTPVTIARGHLDQLARRLGPNEREIDVVSEELTRMERLIDRILLLTRAERGEWLHRGEVPLVTLVEDVVMRWADVAARAWRVGPVVDVVLYADETWLRAALDALLENAVQHTDAYDLIELSAHGEADDVVLSVSDGGAGIDPAVLERIFERFARADVSRSRREGGVGLGLSIAAAIARAHGGSCAARNAPGGGAVFELRLPLRQRRGGIGTRPTLRGRCAGRNRVVTARIDAWPRSIASTALRPSPRWSGRRRSCERSRTPSSRARCARRICSPARAALARRRSRESSRRRSTAHTGRHRRLTGRAMRAWRSRAARRST
jgi:signal transduction histidine kinase